MAQPPGVSRPGGTNFTSDHEEHDMPDNFRWEYDSPAGWGHVLGRTVTDLADALEAHAAEALSAANALRVPGGAA